MPESTTRYVLHVRVEKIVTTPTTGLKAASGPSKERDIEDIVNIVKKSDSLVEGVEFIKGVLNLSIDHNE